MAEIKKYIISVDAGGSSLRALLFDRQGRIVGREQVKTEIISSSSGAIEHDPEELWQKFLFAVNKLLKNLNVKPVEIASIGISVQRAIFTLWDKKGITCCNFISWSDIRAAETTSLMNKNIKWKFVKLGAALVGRFTGSTILTATGMLDFVTDHALSRLNWLFARRPEVYEKAKNGELMFGTLDTWFVYKLTGGKIHATDTSNAASTSLYNHFDFKWNSIFCNLFKIPIGIFPEVKETKDDYGYTTEDLFDGVKIPIGAVVGDQMASLFGHCCFEKGDVKISQGSGSFVDINMGYKPKLSRRGLFPLVAWRIDGMTTYMLEGHLATAGRLIDWLGQGIGLSDTPKVLNELAAECEDSEGVVFVPTPNGIRFPHFKPNVRGTIFGLSLNTHRRHVARAVLQGIAMRLVDILDGIKKDTGIRVRSIKTDGGVSRSDLLLQCVSDLSNHTVERSREHEVAAVGAAYLAGLSAGIWKSFDEISKLEKVYDLFEPRICSVERDKIRKRWKTALKAALSVE
ncbi:MAG: FGGY family carbohydrate kinase [Spirochaetia bacterium]|jgi:glycerol kinase|nr:FGGY family carbohydrate kinase [Spirochaetia bacterium]